MKIFLLSLFFICLYVLQLVAQPGIQWQIALGGTSVDEASSIEQTSDSGFIIAGQSNSIDGDVTGNHGGDDYWIVKLNSAGAIEWQKSLGGSGNDRAQSIQQTIDKGFIVAGTSFSNDGDIMGSHGNGDYWIVKLDSAGTIQWQKSLGGTDTDNANFIQQTNDSGYIVAGWSGSIDGDVTGNHGLGDYWVVKLNNTGGIEWQRSLGGSSFDAATSIRQTTDGGYIVAGFTLSNDSDVTGSHGNYDCWIVKLNSTGTIQWEKSLGGLFSDAAYSIQQTNDSGYIIAGNSDSDDGDVTNNHGGVDCWIVKLDNTGTIQWQKSLGGSGTDVANSIQQTSDGGYVVAGRSNSSDGDVTYNQGAYDFWVVKLSNSGSIQWQESFGGLHNEEAFMIQQSFDGGYVVIGETGSSDGDITGYQGGIFDYWVMKLNSTIGIAEIDNALSTVYIYPNPFLRETILSFKLSSHEKVSIEIRDIEGRLIKNLNPKNLSTGTNELTWDVTNNAGSKVEAGVYFVTIVSGNINETKKVVVLRN